MGHKPGILIVLLGYVLIISVICPRSYRAQSCKNF
nr:MAG TPA: hypothetical protein [Caudoviricetes sp.]